MRDQIIKSFLLLFLSIAVTKVSADPQDRDKLSNKVGTLNPSEEVAFKYEFTDGNFFLILDSEDLKSEFMMVNDEMDFKLVALDKVREKVFLTAPPVHSEIGSTISPYGDDRIDGEKKPGILASIPVESSENNSVTLNFTELLIHGVPGFYGSGKTIDKKRSYIKGVRSIGSSLELEVVVTEITGELPKTYISNWSIARLPKRVMKSRQFDHRMGFFMDVEPESSYWYKADAAIIRWRLEKKNPLAKISDPVKPITFYYDRDVPDKWKPYIKAGIEEWNKAFLAAGFRDALRVKEIPDGADWKVSDLAHSFIRWSESRERKYVSARVYAHGGGNSNRVVDPRSGEILKGDINIWSPLEILKTEYFLKAAAYDPRARQFPYPDTLMGRLIQRLIAHETGHALGIKDGNYGEYAYPVSKMKSEKWLREMGHTPSVMSYARDHGLIEVGDKVSPDLVFQKVGPADIHTIAWGYSEFPINLESEKKDSIINLQNNSPWLRYVRGEMNQGPAYSHNTADNDNPVQSTAISLSNLKRTMGYLPEIALQDQNDNFLLEYLYYRLLDQWVIEMEHVNSMIGGYAVQYKGGNQAGLVYTPLDIKKQEEALHFLLENAFQNTNWLQRPDITLRLNYSETFLNIGSIQAQVLDDLLNVKRFNRIVEQELSIDDSFSLNYFLRILSDSIWKELGRKRVDINPVRMELQANYIKLLKELLEQDKGVMKNGDRISLTFRLSAYSKGMIVNNMRDMKVNLKAALPKATDNSKGHIASMIQEIKSITL